YCQHLNLHSFPTRRSSDLKYYLWAPIHTTTSWYRTRKLLTPFSRIAGPYPPNILQNGSRVSLNHLILWGHTRSGPFIILEGNHRDRKSTRLNSSHLVISYA